MFDNSHVAVFWDVNPSPVTSSRHRFHTNLGGQNGRVTTIYSDNFPPLSVLTDPVLTMSVDSNQLDFVTYKESFFILHLKVNKVIKQFVFSSSISMIASTPQECDFVIKVNNVDYVFHFYLSLGFLSITETIVYDK